MPMIIHFASAAERRRWCRLLHLDDPTDQPARRRTTAQKPAPAKPRRS
jgi:hypothetical protein